MKAQHTPGPWRARPNGGYGQGPINAVFTAESELCGGLLASLDTEPTNPNMEADARLIAAAPELLDALEKLLGLFDSGIRSEYEGTSMLETLLAEGDFARAAIAKATGGAA